MRPKQWIKNLLLFAGVVFTLNTKWTLGSDTMWSFLERATLAFALFSLVASGIYLINDVLDVEKDRKHPKKRLRPIASGALSPMTATVVALILLPGGVTGAFVLAEGFGWVTAAYVLMQIAYVFVLKHVVLLDVFVIATGFVLRAVGGALVIGAEISPWLYTVTLLGALFLGLCKRRNELLLLEDDAGEHRAILSEYTPELLDTLISVVCSATIMAYSLYTFTSPSLPKNHLMMLTVPFVIFGMFRYLYLAHRKNEGGSPEDLLTKDKPLVATMFLWVLAAGAILAFSR
jgi:4-hydroxybenzoate polyprenyltransferase